MSSQATIARPTFNPSNIPQELKDLNQWVMWKLESRDDGGLTKVPYQTNGWKASATGSSTWNTFENCLQAMESGKFSGIGIVLTKKNGITCVDLDHSIDRNRPAVEMLSEKAKSILHQANSYTEISQSGGGLHIFVRGNLPETNGKRNRNGQVEAYDNARFIATTGGRLSGSPQKINDFDVKAFHLKYLAFVSNSKPDSPSDNSPSGKDFQVALTVWKQLGRDADFAKAKLEFLKQADDRPKLSRDDYVNPTLTHAWEKLYGNSNSASAKKKCSGQSRLIFPEGSEEFFYSPFDFVTQPPDEYTDGWFPLGDVSLIAGLSGASKSTLMFQFLIAQAAGEPFLGHTTLGRSFMVVALDRSENSVARTLTRMKITREDIRLEQIRSAHPFPFAQNLIELMEKRNRPEIVFIEGYDMVVDPNDGEQVVEGVHFLQEIGKHYHTAIVCSVGSPKVKKKEGYADKRDLVTGSGKWSRVTETIVHICNPDPEKRSKESKARRTVEVMHRNGPSEDFNLRFLNGRLVIDDTIPKAETKFDIPEWLQWIQANKNDGSWFTAEAMSDGIDRAARTCRKICKTGVDDGYLRLKTGQRKSTDPMEYQLISH